MIKNDKPENVQGQGVPTNNTSTTTDSSVEAKAGATAPAASASLLGKDDSLTATVRGTDSAEDKKERKSTSGNKADKSGKSGKGVRGKKAVEAQAAGVPDQTGNTGATTAPQNDAAGDGAQTTGADTASEASAEKEVSFMDAVAERLEQKLRAQDRSEREVAYILTIFKDGRLLLRSVFADVPVSKFMADIFPEQPKYTEENVEEAATVLSQIIPHFYAIPVDPKTPQDFGGSGDMLDMFKGTALEALGELAEDLGFGGFGSGKASDGSFKGLGGLGGLFGHPLFGGATGGTEPRSNDGFPQGLDGLSALFGGLFGFPTDEDSSNEQCEGCGDCGCGYSPEADFEEVYSEGAKIWKFDMGQSHERTVTVPAGSIVLSAIEQNGEVVVYIQVPNAGIGGVDEEHYSLQTYGTGRKIPAEVLMEARFIGTVKLLDTSVVHVYAQLVESE